MKTHRFHLRLSALSLVLMLTLPLQIGAQTLTPPVTGVVAVGNNHVVALKSDGTVWAWGDNTNGALGDGTTTSRGTPAQVSGLSGIVAVAAAAGHSLALKSDGTVWTWGVNGSGQIGDGTTANRLAPYQVSGLSGVVAIASCAPGTVAVLKSDGTVWAWGANERGQVGDGTTTNRSAAVQVSGLTAITKISGGQRAFLALKDDGTVWGWGWNNAGQLGDGTTTDRPSPVQVYGISGAVAVSEGTSVSMILKADGSVWAWGNNVAGQVGDGTTTTRTSPVKITGLGSVTAIAAANGQNSLAVTSDGNVWAWGENSLGQLGNGSTNNQISPIRVNGVAGAVAVATRNSTIVILKSDGTLSLLGNNASGQFGDGSTLGLSPLTMSGMNNVASIVASNSYSVALKTDGTVWAWGSNSYGQLGDGTTVSRPDTRVVPGLARVSAIGASETHVLAITNDSTLWAWGNNDNGALGDGTTTSHPTPIQITAINGVVAVAPASQYSAVLRNDGTVWCWGYNGGGSLGDGTTTNRSLPGQVNGLTNVIAIYSGYRHTLALKADGTVWAWGWNSTGQLGDGTTDNRSTPVQVSGLTGIVALGATSNANVGGSSFALKNDGTLWAWGHNASGELGDGTATQQNTPVLVPSLSGVTAIAGGYRHALALKSDGTLWAWGDNYSGDLGDGTMTQRNSPVLVPGLTGCLAVAGGTFDSMAIKADRTVAVWGSLRSGQLGYTIPVTGQAAIRLTASAIDSNQNGLPDGWEIDHFGNLNHSGTTDSDGDGLTDMQEFVLGSDPTKADTDGDGVNDFFDPFPLDPHNGALTTNTLSTNSLTVNLGTITGGGVTDLTLNAGGTNQNVSIVSSGSGSTVIPRGRLGIGTTTPQHLIQMVSSTDATIQLTNSSTGGGSWFLNSTPDTAGPDPIGSFSVANDFSGAGFSINPERRNFYFEGGGGAGGMGLNVGFGRTSPAPQNGAILAGNLGVGTATPTEKLDVTGNANVSGNATIAGTLSAASLQIAGQPFNPANYLQQSGGTVTGTLSATALTATAGSISGGATGLTLSAGGSGNQNITLAPTGAGNTILNGNVGVGSATPNAKLHLVAAGQSGATTAFQVDNSANVAKFKVLDNGTVVINGPGNGTGGTSLQMNQAGGGPASFIFLDNGRFAMGIGTSAPVGNLDITDAATATLNLNGFNGNGGIPGTVNLGPASILSQRNASGDTHYGSLIFKTTDAGGLVEAMRITSLGNVGIGTATPTAKLDVNGSFNAQSLSIAGQPFNPANYVQQSGGTVTGTLSATALTATAGSISGGATGLTLNAGGSGNQNITLAPTGAGNTILNGKVGIGTATPGTKLHIHQTGQNSSREYFENLTLSDDANALGGLANGTSVDGIFVPTFFGYRNGTVNTVAAQIWGVISSTGDIAGNVPLVYINAATTSSPTDPLNGTFSSVANRNLLGVANSGVSLLTVAASGRVGIGTASPAVKLDVVGNANISTDLAVGGTLNTASLQIGGVSFVPANYVAISGSYPNPAWLTSLSAAKLTTGTLPASAMPAYTGDVTASAGSTALILANSGATAGTYSKVTVDAKGRVTTGEALAFGDVTTALGYTPYNATTNSAGYITAASLPSVPVQSVFGRTGAVSLTSADVTSALTFTPLSNLGNTAVAPLDFAASSYVRFGHANQSDGNDGRIGAGLFGSGLNLVGTQTVAGEGRIIRLWGTLKDSSGANYYNSANLTNLSQLANGPGYITAAGAPVQSVFGRTGNIVPVNSDITGALGYIPVNRAGDAMSGALSVFALTTTSGVISGSAGLSLNAGGAGDQNVTLTPTGNGITTTARRLTVTDSTASTSAASGAVVVSGGVGVGGSLNVAGNAGVTGGLNVGANVSVAGQTGTGSLIVAGAAQTGTLSVTGNAEVAGQTTTASLHVTGASTLDGGATITGQTTTTNLSVAQNATIAGSASLGSATIAGAFTASGPATFSSGASVTGLINVTGNQSVSGNSSVAGSLSIGGSAISGAPFDIRVGNDNLYISNWGDNRMGLQSYIDGHFSDRATYAPSETRLLLQPDGGWVGIGTVNPQVALDVQASTDLLIARFLGASSGNQFVVVGNASASLAIGTGATGGVTGSVPYLWSTNGKFMIGNDSAPAFFVDGMGAGTKVGIGTPTPAAKLDVYGGVLGNNAGDRVSLATFHFNAANNEYLNVTGVRSNAGTDWNSSDLYLRRTVDSSDQGFVKFTGWDVALGTGSSEAIHVAYTGNVGIGTPTPNYKLSVVGTIHAQEIIVDSSGADYVFAPSYRLRPLAEVEEHIKAHGHLPDIPSAAEVSAHGMSLGDMQAKLLAKIEELTLHQIEQEKRLAEQSARIERLESENARLQSIR